MGAVSYFLISFDSCLNWGDKISIDRTFQSDLSKIDLTNILISSE